MGSNYKINYNVDIVFCIDATGSMGNFLNTVQENALSLYDDIRGYMNQNENAKHVDALRVRVIAFRDYIDNSSDAMMMTNFFNLPQEADKLKMSIASLVAKGGGDDPEDGLEALAYAMKSDWTTGGDKRRHIIILWTDDDAHPIGFAKNAKGYPKGMPTDMRELTAWWRDKSAPGCMNQEAKRLILFAPDAPEWNKLSSAWNAVLHYPSMAGNGLQELDYKVILSTIYKSI